MRATVSPCVRHAGRDGPTIGMSGSQGKRRLAAAQPREKKSATGPQPWAKEEEQRWKFEKPVSKPNDGYAEEVGGG